MSTEEGKEASAARLASLAERTAYARAFEAVLWSLPVANTLAPRRAGNDRGIPSSALFITEQRPTGKLWLVSCNAESPYIFGDLTTTDGPMVFEVPRADKRAKFSGSIVDLWWMPLEDIGPEGADAGKGGKYLVLPPGYQGLIPSGYIVLRSRTYRINELFRATPAQKGDAGWAAAVAYAKKLKVYPLAEAASPKPAPLIDVSQGAFAGTPTFDRTYFQFIDQLVQEEPVLEHDKAMMGMLAHLGFQKGKPFRPDERLGRILDRAAEDVQRYCVDMLETERSVMTGAKFWPNRQWMLPGIGRDVAVGGAQWLFPDRLDYITRATFYYSGIGVQKHFGAMSIYPLTTRDSKGNALDGGKHYRLHLPKDVPANDFWELIAYSPLTRSFIDTPANRIAVSSANPMYETNGDGSIDIDIGPDAPAGRENNWISTRRGEPIKMCLRFYGPQQRLLEKQWNPGDLEEVA